MTCLTEVPPAPSVQVVAAGAAVRPKAVSQAVALPAAPVSTPSPSVPPPATASSPAARRARQVTEAPRLVAAIRDHLPPTERTGHDEDKSGRISAGGTTRRRSGGRNRRPAASARREVNGIAA